MGKGKKKMKLIASALAIGAGVAAVNAVRKKNAEGGQGDSPKSTEKKGMPEERKEELKQFRNTERGKYEKNSKGIYYTMVIMKPLRVLRSLKASMGSQHTL